MFHRGSRYILVLSIAACSGSSGDDIWTPPGGGGKADGYTTIKGSDIPSQFVDPNKYYILSRNIANLSTVGALDSVEGPLAKRIDGIIANQPADGLMGLAELVRMENPTIHASLFPQEQAALPKLWAVMEAPTANDTLYGPKDNFGVVDASNPPAAAVPPALLAISSLSSDLQAPAQRLENIYNSDNDLTTVTLADLAMGIANPASFTPAEIAAFGSIQAVFRTQAVATADATIDLSPGPGQTTFDATLGPASFHMVGATQIDETRNVYAQSFTSSFGATQMLNATVALPMGAQLLLVNQDTGAEVVFGAGTVPSLPRGNFTFEAWQNGQRMFSSNVDFPLMTNSQRIDLGDKLDYNVTSGLTTLIRNLNAATQMWNGSYYAYAVHYTYDKMTIPPPQGASQQAVIATSSPAITLPVGRYSFPQSGANLYVYPNNVLWFNNRGTLTRLIPYGNSGSQVTRLMGLNNSYIQFDASANSIYCSNCNPTVSQTLTAAMRDI